MTRDRTTTSYAVLGLLAIRPWTTYELAKQVQRSLRWFWPRAERKLYDEPKRLAADGLATATREHTGKRGAAPSTPSPRPAAPLCATGSASRRSPDHRVRGHGQGLLRRCRVHRAAARVAGGASSSRPPSGSRRSPPAATRPLAFPERAHLSALTMQLSASRRRPRRAGRAGRVSRSSSGRTPPTRRAGMPRPSCPRSPGVAATVVRFRHDHRADVGDAPGDARPVRRLRRRHQPQPPGHPLLVPVAPDQRRRDRASWGDGRTARRRCGRCASGSTRRAS